MKRIVGIMLATLLLASAAGAQFQGEGDLVITADGSVVGVGEFEDGNVELELLAGFTGFASITLVDESGAERTFDVMIDEDARVVLSETLEDLRSVVGETGGEVTIEVQESLQTSGNAAFGVAVPDHVELPEVALEGMAQAEANRDAAQERGGEGSSHGNEVSAEGRARGEASAGEDAGEAEVEVEGEASVGLDLGSKK